MNDESNDADSTPSNILLKDGSVELNDLREIAERSFMKTRLLRVLLKEQEYELDQMHIPSDELAQMTTAKQQAYLQAIDEDVFLWMHLPSFRKCSLYDLQLVLRCQNTFSQAIDIAHKIWTDPAKTAAFERRSLILVARSVDLVEAVLAEVGTEIDYDHSLAQWWYRSHRERFHIKGIKEIDEVSLSLSDQVELLYESLLHLRVESGIDEGLILDLDGELP